MGGVEQGGATCLWKQQAPSGSSPALSGSGIRPSGPSSHSPQTHWSNWAQEVRKKEADQEEIQDTHRAPKKSVPVQAGLHRQVEPDGV